MSIQNERTSGATDEIRWRDRYKRNELCVVIVSVEKLSRGLRGLSWSETHNFLSWSEISLSWSECRFRFLLGVSLEDAATNAPDLF